MSGIKIRNPDDSNVQARVDDIDNAMKSIRDKGFINFYGMQRFGTSTVPTHVTGLLLLQGKWGEAIDTILSLREGEHPDCTRGRLAWLEDGDFNKALELMPRRSVAERSIWEHWRKGHRQEDKVGALGNVRAALCWLLTSRSRETSGRCMFTPIKATSGTSWPPSG